MTNAQFHCEDCGTAVDLYADTCPRCGKTFDAVKCPRCQHSDRPKAFQNGCPKCGYLKKQRPPLVASAPKPALFGPLMTVLVIFLLIAVIITWMIR